MRLPLLDSRYTGHQRAFLKIQDGCDAHCTYCIIPKLRPRLWSKPAEDCLEEARRLVAAGHRELILTGIFLSAYGHTTALRRRQNLMRSPLAELLERLCNEIPDLERVRLSSLEPGDLTPDLLRLMRSLPRIAPHFHLPLQSGSANILRRMNRQYTRDEYLRMIDAVHAAYDRVALTTDVITGFPGETDDDFAQTLDVVERARFIHIHAFPFSPRPGTAAARWKSEQIPGQIANRRVEILSQRAAHHSHAFRSTFVGQSVRVHVEQADADWPIQHGRTAWYFPVHFRDSRRLAGRTADLRIERVDANETWGIPV
jgi:threonylcarbamoyladenosine tRNA methylthiotransferase MtaB